MELKVNVDGVERSISGVSNETTCAQIIYALAHAISQKGRFVMIEKYRNRERRLSPVDKPLELLEKWREHMSNVTFVLKKIDDEEDNSSPSDMTPRKNWKQCFDFVYFYESRSDYNSVMEQKFASLGRGAHSHPPLLMLPDEDMSIARMGLSQNDLLVLIEKQRFLFLCFQENLRNILTPMRESNWPQQYQKQLKQSHKLRAAIEATKEAIDKTMSDIENVRLREQELQKRLTELNDPTSTPQRTAASLPISSSSSSPKLKAC
ncbi:unnamed protein product [Haemonchus placei]|uniref:Ras-associating domain-containing protein n=1 Tax=Haemonchus placei TaxID=6290 RepID=A0A0N4W375_HAEPC|nr:unnamed protein product [Haemonchus placei]